jgi:putative SOS response-associated peptidase YedK
LCNLYTVRKSAEEVARHFGVRPPKDLPNTPEEVYPGAPGLVIREKEGERVLQSMVWGFPLRLSTSPTPSRRRSLSR